MDLLDRHSRLVSMWMAGLKMDAIGAELGCQRGVVLRTAHMIGLPHRGVGKRPINLWPCVLHWARLGFTPEQIADGIGATGKARRILLGERERNVKRSKPENAASKPPLAYAGNALKDMVSPVGYDPTTL